MECEKNEVKKRKDEGMGQGEFVRAIQACRRRLNMAAFLEKLVFVLGVGAIAGILFQMVSLVMPLYYVGLYVGLAFVFAVSAAVIAAVVKRVSMEQAALVMDSFGFDERIVTAYGNLEKEGAMVELQRADAMRLLHVHQNQIQITLLPPWQKIVSLSALFIVLIILSLMPSEMKEHAKELHSVKEEAREKTAEIEDIIEALEQLVNEEEMTPEQKMSFQEMVEGLQASQEEYQQASSKEMMKAASEKLAYRYENMGNQLAGLAQSLKNGATVSPVTSEAMQVLSEKIQKMSGEQLAMQDTNSQSGDNSASGQDGQNAQSGSAGDNGQSGQSGESGQNGDSGQSGDNGQNGQGGQSGDNGQNGNGGQSGDNGQDGQSGQDSDQGNSEQNNSSKEGGPDGDPGNGRGTGTNNTPHDYVSIPNDIADSDNITGNAVNHDASEYFHAQNGLSWEGEHMPHEAIIGSYAQNAYEGIAAGKYPSGMEEIIKEYFSNFD